MKKVIWYFSSVALVLIIAISAVVPAGCETGSGAALTVSTSDNVTFTVDTNSVTKGDLALPLEWRVSNPALGTITSSSGYSAVYSRTSQSGVNVIIVEDQYGAEGMATVNQ